MVTLEQDMSSRIVEAVAAARDVDPTELRPLYEVVDPDALDAFVASVAGEDGADSAIVRFEYEGETVLIRGDGSVRVGKPVDFVEGE